MNSLVKVLIGLYPNVDYLLFRAAAAAVPARSMAIGLRQGFECGRIPVETDEVQGRRTVDRRCTSEQARDEFRIAFHRDALDSCADSRLHRRGESGESAIPVACRPSLSPGSSQSRHQERGPNTCTMGGILSST